jgi:hypothetical protein
MKLNDQLHTPLLDKHGWFMKENQLNIMVSECVWCLPHAVSQWVWRRGSRKNQVFTEMC